MTEKLKFTASYRKTINIGNFESEQFGISHEFEVDGELSPMDALKLVKRQTEEVMYGMGMSQE